MTDAPRPAPDHIRLALEHIRAAEVEERHNMHPAHTAIVHEIVHAAVCLGRVLHLRGESVQP